MGVEGALDNVKLFFIVIFWVNGAATGLQQIKGEGGLNTLQGKVIQERLVRYSCT